MLEHYLFCKARARQPTTLSVLVDTNHPAFPKWRPLLYGMKKRSCKFCPGLTFWIDESEPDNSQTSLRDVGKSAYSMAFQSVVAGVPSTALADTGVSRCFMDINFTRQNNFVLRPTKTGVTLADGSYASMVHKTNPLVLRMGKHFSVQTFYAIDMRQEYDNILGNNWLTAHDAVLFVSEKVCVLRRHGTRYISRSVAAPQRKPTHSGPFINVDQVARLYRTSANVRAFQIAVRATPDDSPSRRSMVITCGWFFQQLRENEFKIKLAKCKFERSDVKFLGHIVGADGVKVDPDKISAIVHWPTSSTLQSSQTQTRSFF